MNPIESFELSNPQKRIWLTELLNERKDMSNIGYLIELKGEYDLQQLARAIKYVVKANPALQLNFKYPPEKKSDLLQYLPEYREVEVKIIETTGEKELFKKIEALHREQFDITAKYLCSFAVFSINKKRFGLFEKANHLVADGISAIIVANETIDTYEKLMNNDFKEIKKEYSYIDFLKDEKEYIGSEKYLKAKEFWLQKFQDFQGEDITFKSNKSKKNSLIVKRGNFHIPAGSIKLLEDYKTENRLANFVLFMAALAIYFNRFHFHDDLVIGMPVHNRSKKIFRNMVGMFVSTVPLRIKFEEKWTFNDLLAYLKREIWDALKHQSYPFNHLVKDFNDANINTSGLLNVQLIELPGGNDEFTEKRAFFSTQYNISHLSLYLNQQNSKFLEDLEIAVDYHGDIFEEREIEVFFKRLMVILEQAVKEPEKEIAQLSLLEEAEYKELIDELNDTGTGFPKEKTLAQLFEEQVIKNPGNIALEYEEKQVTYKELNDLTDKLAAKLQGAGITPGAIVGILCERSIEAVVCILAVLKAGGAYVPIDPAYPMERKNYIFENSEIKILLIEKALEQQESQLINENQNINPIIIDYQTLKEETIDREFQEPAVTGDDLAYVIYTSGTTGQPKGTLLRHRNVINYIWWGAHFYVKGETISFPLYTSLSFDLTVTSIFIPLVTGNKIVIYRDSKEGLLIERVAGENKVDIIKLTPSHLKVIKETKCDTSRIKSFIVGGEELKTDTAGEIDAYFDGNINIYNEYGPTETAVGCMIHRYDKNTDHGIGVPIGKPSDNVKIYILDKHKRPLPLGIIGEIYIGGAGVAGGYLKNPELTAEKFVDNPFIPGEKMYKSGDLGRWNLDKTLEFYGRSDEQVKIRGYRIEPGEIEKQLLNLQDIKDAVVVVVEDKAGQKSLCAYMVPETDLAEGLDTRTLRKKLSENLPDYMIPAYFVTLDEIPLTNNGKVDRRALPEPRVTVTKESGAVPVGDEEKNIKKIWADVLNLEAIGMEDNFFELGGDSIKAVQIASRMNDIELSVNASEILTHQTIDQLVLHVDFNREKKIYKQDPIQGTKQLSPIESWFFENDFKNPHYYNQSVLLEFEEPINQDIMAKCFKTLIKQHDGLRINVDLENKTLFYNNRHLEGGFEIEIFDIPDGNNWQDKVREIGEKAKSSFDLRDSLLIKPAIIRPGSGKEKLLMTAHHLVIDGVSWRILLEDLYNLYRGLSKGEEVTLPDKTASLTDWLNSLQQYSQKQELTEQISYWNQIIDTDFSLDSGKTGDEGIGLIKDRGKISFQMDQEETDILSTKTRESFKSDIEVSLVTALGIALKEYTGSEKILLEMENNGRILEDIDLSRTIGWFTALYPRSIIMDREDLTGHIKSVKEQLAKTPDKGIGYGILKYLSKQITGDYKSRVRFNYLGQFDREISNDIFAYSDIFTGEEIGADNGLSTQIEINCMIMRGSLVFDLYYSKKVFDEESIGRLFDLVKDTLQQMVSYYRTEDEVHFTPSDFDTVDLGEDDLEALFG